MIEKAVFRKVGGVHGDRLGEDFLVKSVQIVGNGRRSVCVESTGIWTGLVAFDEEGLQDFISVDYCVFPVGYSIER